MMFPPDQRPNLCNKHGRTIPDIFAADAAIAAAAVQHGAGGAGMKTRVYGRNSGGCSGGGDSDGGKGARHHSACGAAASSAAGATNAAADAVAQEYPGFASIVRMDFVQEAGQTVFVPAGWYHQVENIVETLSVNCNWINSCNIGDMFEVLCQDLALAKDATADCKEMNDYENHCQILLKANNGFDFWELFQLLKVIASARIAKLSGKGLEETAEPAEKVAVEKAAGETAKSKTTAFEEHLWKYELKQIAITLAKLHPEMAAVGQSVARLAAVKALAAQLEQQLQMHQEAKA